MRLPLLAALLLSFLMVSPAALAQAGERSASETDSVFDRGCGDDDGNDRCDADVQRQMRERYGIADAETLAGQGMTLRRVMYVDGYGNDVAAITFSRAPGRSPMVEIRTPRAAQGDAVQPLSAVVSAETWQKALTASQDFDRKLADEWAPDEVARGDAIRLCLHAWFVVAEAVDAERLSQNTTGQVEPSRVRRDAETGCADGLAMPFAFALADLALESLPECSTLDIAAERNTTTLLATCSRLGGDRLAAGEAMKLVSKLQGHKDDLPQGSEFGWLFASSARALAEPLRVALTSSNAGLYFDAPRASDVDHATVHGEVVFWREGEGQDELADLTLTLVREFGDFRIQSYELGERRPRP